MADVAAPGAAAPVRSKKAGSEWFWRVLAIIMVAVIAWVAWIAYQLNPPQLVTSAAFEAAAKARATQNAEGKIAGAGTENPVEHSQPALPVESSKPAEPREPPVNVDKLKMSDTLTTSSVPPANARAVQ